eukprot:NODE_2095_length_1691_cov_55.056760_g1791_i0.p1 GENE.NODE_2095_length_1691_cov_55.056760_g1791_i0~~NODE_2095_length_1691_cov_55.056760_g1791_i0.p1  ORF type:complete len:265 (+),score=38.71 NODE_2095_length_1691_cov_55.056760_g1791_i0:64-858(+)
MTILSIERVEPEIDQICEYGCYINEVCSPLETIICEDKSDALWQDVAKTLCSNESEEELEMKVKDPEIEIEESMTMCSIETLPLQHPDDNEKYTIVFDLDETLTYARDGKIRPRPHIDNMFKTLKKRCEVIVWTAGLRVYANRVVSALDKFKVIKHCVCRSESWQPTPQGFAKDLRLLNRNIERTIIIENTPDCVVKNPLHSIIVPDYIREDPEDKTMSVITTILDQLVESKQDVPDFLASCPLLRLETLRNGNGQVLHVFMLK